MWIVKLIIDSTRSQTWTFLADEEHLLRTVASRPTPLTDVREWHTVLGARRRFRRQKLGPIHRCRRLFWNISFSPRKFYSSAVHVIVLLSVCPSVTLNFSRISRKRVLLCRKCANFTRGDKRWSQFFPLVWNEIKTVKNLNFPYGLWIASNVQHLWRW